MNSQMDDAQNDLLRTLAKKQSEMEAEITINHRAMTMMFSFILGELEEHNPGVKEQVAQTLKTVKIQLKDDLITCLAADQILNFIE